MDKPEASELPVQASESRLQSLRNMASDALDTAASHAKNAANSATEFASQAADTASTIAGKAVELVGDLNGDGKIDEEDLKIAIAKGKEVAATVADEVGSLAKEVVRSDLVKDTAAGAAVGAALFSVLPLVGTTTGAVVGGAAVAMKKLLTK